MSMFDVLACGFGSAVAGALLFGLPAHSLSDSLPTIVLLLSAGSLAGSILGWQGRKECRWRFAARERDAGVSAPRDES